jgi:signal transduction histidine kinase
LLRRSRRQTAELHRLSEELQAERAKHEAEAAEAERRRIARELHDVISHSVSLMVVQAGAAEQLLNGDGAAREAVHAVRETGKEALAELRRQLAVLREGEGGPSTSLPGLAEIPALVERSGGILTTHGTKPDDVPAGLALTVYRMVQEGLTNARRHAADSPVSVVLDYEADCVGVTVEDEGGAVRRAKVPAKGSSGSASASRCTTASSKQDPGPTAPAGDCTPGCPSAGGGDHDPNPSGRRPGAGPPWPAADDRPGGGPRGLR